MIKIIIRWVINALVLMGIALIVPGFFVTNFYAALIAAIVLAIINGLIKPILVLLTLPINILTLGLFTLVINAFIFWFTATIVKGFGVETFWAAFFAALVYSIISVIINWLTRED